MAFSGYLDSKCVLELELAILREATFQNLSNAVSRTLTPLKEMHTTPIHKATCKDWAIYKFDGAVGDFRNFVPLL